MIFTIGLILFFIGKQIHDQLGNCFLFTPNKYNTIGEWLGIIGALLVAYSLLSVAWVQLP